MHSHARLLFCSGIFCSVSAALCSSAASAEVIWTWDFSTGDLSQWSSQEVADPGLLTIVTSPTPPNEKYAMQVLVQQGDFVDDGNRSEIDYTGDSPQEGDERYYRWQTLFPSDYQTADYWQLFTQWHQYISGGSPPLAFLVNGNQIMLGNNLDFYYWKGPLELGSWHDFVVHVLWSSDPSVGGAEVWYDGQHVCSFTNGQTLFPGDTVYLKQGLYRKDLITWDQTLYHAGMTVGTELSDVAPDLVAAQDGGSTDGGAPAVVAATTAAGEMTVTSSNGAASTVVPGSGCASAGASWPAALVLATGVVLFRRRSVRTA